MGNDTFVPYAVKSGTHLLSTSNENLCQENPIEIAEPTNDLTVNFPPRSLNTYIFMIAHDDDVVEAPKQEEKTASKAYYDLRGRRTDKPSGLVIEQRADGTVRKVLRKPSAL